MCMLVNRKTLMQKLKTLSPSLGKEGSQKCFHFNGGHISAYNGTVLTSVKFDCGELSFSVPAKKFQKLLSVLKSDVVELVLRRNVLKVVSASIEAEFSLEHGNGAAIQLPDEMMKYDDFGTLLDGLKACTKVASKDELDGNLCGVSMLERGLCATNKFSIVRWSLPSELEDLTCTVPVDFIRSLSAIKDISNVRIGRKKNILAVETGDGTIVSTALMVGSYPDLNDFFPKGNGVSVTFEEPIDEILCKHREYQIDVDLGEQEVEFCIEGSHCTLTSHVGDFGCLREDVDVTASTDVDCIFYVSPTLFDGIGKCKQFNYYPKEGVLVVRSELFELMIRLRKNNG